MSVMTDVTEMRRWLTLRCEHCGHRFRRKNDHRHSFGNRDGKVYHRACMAAISWKRKADERLMVVGILSELSGLGSRDVQAVAELRSPDENTRVDQANIIWRVFYDLSKATQEEPRD